MRILVAGATGTLGQPLVRALVARGHETIGLTRSAARRGIVEACGARAAVADALDAAALAIALRDAAPTHVVHALTALPPAGPMRPRDLRGTNVVRTRGTANLLAAAAAAGVRRLVGESFLAVYGPGTSELARGEDGPLTDPGRGALRETVLALRDLERQLREASAGGAMESVVLRYGGFYGPRVPSTESLVQQIRAGRLFAPATASGLMPFVHIDDAVAATVATLEHSHPDFAYNVVDDEPMPVPAFLAAAAAAFGGRPPRAIPGWLLRVLAPVAHQMVSWRVALSNAKAKAQLGWSPRFPTAREGLRHAAGSLSAMA